MRHQQLLRLKIALQSGIVLIQETDHLNAGRLLIDMEMIALCFHMWHFYLRNRVFSNLSNTYLPQQIYHQVCGMLTV